MQSCTEEFVPETKTFEDLLVVEATITNEFKTQEVKISRTYTFEEDRPELVVNAIVFVSDNTGKKYLFQYNEEKGLYTSISKFQAKQGNKYTLNITTNNGTTFTSSPEPLPPINQVSVNFEKKEINGKYGVQIMANNYDPTNSSHYYRYEYQETYKVISPYWGPYKAILVPVPTSISLSGYTIDYELRDEQQTKVCYVTKNSKDIKLAKTTEKTEDRITNFPIRFISSDNYILTYKYSILVKQYVENYESYIFHRTLKKISGSDGSVLSPNQPGFLKGNLSAEDNPDKKIIGYFSVASVSSKRIFLDDHSALFPNQPIPDFFTACRVIKLNNTPPTAVNTRVPQYYQLMGYIKNEEMFLYRPEGNIFWMVPPPCTDCTTYASNEKPEFWP